MRGLRTRRLRLRWAGAFPGGIRRVGGRLGGRLRGRCGRFGGGSVFFGLEVEWIDVVGFAEDSEWIGARIAAAVVVMVGDRALRRRCLALLAPWGHRDGRVRCLRLPGSAILALA